MEILELFRTGEASPIFLTLALSILASLIMNLSTAKWRGYRIKPAFFSAFIPFINIYFSCAYLFLAIFKKDFIQSS